MAADGRRTDPAVADLLFAEAWRFDFSQAARLLELLDPGATPPGEGADPAAEPVRFSARMGLDFPASEVAAVERSEDGRPPEMSVHLISLAGAMGPLPTAVSERIVERAFRGDTAFADFLDLFHHRLVSLLWRARKRRRPTLPVGAPGRGAHARCGLALLGLATGGLAGRMGVEDRSLLVYAGLAAQRPRSAVGLRILLADHFEVPVEVRPYAGRWLAVADEELTRLGRGGRLAGGGAGALLGARVWDQGAGFELRLGPLGLHQYLDFLPLGRGFLALAELVRFWAGREPAWTARLSLKSAEVPECRLGVGARLGWTSWLARAHPVREACRLGSGARLGRTSWLARRDGMREAFVVVREHGG